MIVKVNNGEPIVWLDYVFKNAEHYTLKALNLCAAQLRIWKGSVDLPRVDGNSDKVTYIRED